MAIFDDATNERQRDLPPQRVATFDPVYGDESAAPGGGATGGWEPVFAGGGGASRGAGASGRMASGVTGTWDEAPPVLAAESMFGVPVPAQPAVQETGNLPGWVTSPMEAFNSVVRPGSASAQSYNAREGVAPRPEAQVSPSLLEPRQGPLGMGWHRSGVQAGIPQTEGGQNSGPLATAVNTAGPTDAPPVIDRLAGTRAELAAMNAREAADVQERGRAMVAGGRLMTAGQDLEQAKQADRFATWRAQNGADMVLAPENSGYDMQRRGILDAAGAARGALATARGEYAAAQTGLTGNRNYIDEFAKTQGALSEAERARGASALTSSQAEENRQGANLKGQQVQAGAQEAAIRAQLQKETVPAKIKVLQNKLLAMLGKQPANRVALVDVDSGTTDVLGQPRYIKQAIDVETGQPVGGGQAAAAGRRPPQQAIDMLRKDPNLARQFEENYGLPKGGAAQYLQ